MAQTLASPRFDEEAVRTRGSPVPTGSLIREDQVADDPIVVRTGSRSDTATVALLHAEEIPEGFLSSLGAPFLTRLYRRIVKSPAAFLVVAEAVGEEDERTIGFIAGSTDVGRLYREFLWRDGLLAAGSVARRLLPSWRQASETLRHGVRREGADRGAELLAVAVDPACRGRGTGRRLVREFLREVVDRDQDTASVVLGEDNRAAWHLYEEAGFRPVRQFELHAGRRSLVMQWTRPAPDGRGRGAQA